MAGSDSKRIAKNTVMLYFRMILSTLISLYTSRVVLDVLGVDDYGVYGVVGGIVAVMGFLNSSMSGATSRFITYELGRKDYNKLRDTFSSSLIIHVGIALLVLVLAETVGLWFLNHKLVIPADSMTAANWVYQISILSAMIGVTQVPYMATIIAHEKMSVYAYVEILNVTMKLLVVFLLYITPGDKLIIYALLYAGASMVTAMTYRIYCIREFEESRFRWIWNKNILRPMLSFSGWDIFGNICGMSFYQGTTFILNIFFGVAVNAANSIAATVSGVLVGLSNNVTAAYRPHIVKQYAAGEYVKMSVAMSQGIMFVVLLTSIVCVPALLEMPLIIRLWLGQEPAYTVVFCRILMIVFMLGQINAYCNIAIHASGKIKWLSFGGGMLYLLTLPAMYILFKLGFEPYYAFVVHLVCRFFLIAQGLLIIHKVIPALKLMPFIKVVIKTLALSVISFFICQYAVGFMSDSIFRLLLVGILNLIVLCVSAYIFMLTRDQRHMVLAKLRLAK